MTSLIAAALAVCLNGSWQFKFEENKPLEETSLKTFTANDVMTVPGCWDVLPRYYLKRGTGLYRRAFTLTEPMKDAVLVVDGMGVRAAFALDGVDKGRYDYPYARLEIPVGPLAAGTHEIAAAVDNILEWPRVKLARPYYDFYFYGGFYHGVKLVERAPKVFVRTRDYQTGTIEVAVEGAVVEGAAVRVDGQPVETAWKGGRATLRVPSFRLWTPDAPNLHTLAVSCAGAAVQPADVRFGIRQIEAKGGKMYLNGRELFLKGFNRHESSVLEGSATGETTMLRDLQNLKAVGGNFIRGAHYQQSERFLDLCDEMGVLVWEESLGWGNGSHGGKMSSYELTNETFIAEQLIETREMVRASFNHPSVIIFAFMNEFASGSKPGKALADKLIAAVRAEDSGRLVTYACCHNGSDIANANTDLVAFNTYPGWIGSDAGDPANLRRLIKEDVDKVVSRFRRLYPHKPIIVAEMGTCGVYGHHDPAGAQWTEEFEAEYVGDVLDVVFAHPEITGMTIWQFTDARSYHRGGATIRTKPFAQNLAGLYDGFRRPKAVVPVVKAKFAQKAKMEER